MLPLWCLRSLLKHFFGSADTDFIRETFVTIDFYEYYVYYFICYAPKTPTSSYSYCKISFSDMLKYHVHFKFSLDDMNKVLPEITG